MPGQTTLAAALSTLASTSISSSASSNLDTEPTQPTLADVLPLYARLAGFSLLPPPPRLPLTPSSLSPKHPPRPRTRKPKCPPTPATPTQPALLSTFPLDALRAFEHALDKSPPACAAAARLRTEYYAHRLLHACARCACVRCLLLCADAAASGPSPSPSASSHPTPNTPSHPNAPASSQSTPNAFSQLSIGTDASASASASPRDPDLFGTDADLQFTWGAAGRRALRAVGGVFATMDFDRELGFELDMGVGRCRETDEVLRALGVGLCECTFGSGHKCEVEQESCEAEVGRYIVTPSLKMARKARKMRRRARAASSSSEGSTSAYDPYAPSTSANRL